MGVPELTQAINAYHSVSVSPEFQELERMRVRADHDEAQALWNAERKAKREEKFEIAKNVPNAETLEAIKETQEMKKDPSSGKGYTDVDEMMADIL